MRRFFFCIILSSSLGALELNRVILSADNNPLYIEFWEVVAPLWKKMGLQPTLALIADESCQVDTSLGDVIRFPPIEGISVALQAQVIRLFLPIFFPNDGCLISDIDMLPISRDYFINGAMMCPDDAFLVYRDRAYDGTRYPMCYLAGKGRTFASLVGIHHPDEIPRHLRIWEGYGFKWETDEKVLYILLHHWERKKKNRVVRLGHSVSQRLDRDSWAIDDHIDISGFIDCHCPRPYSTYRESIDRIVDAIYRLQ